MGNGMRRGPGMGPGRAEKPKDLIGTWKKLLVYCKKHLPLILTAVVCAIGGTVLTLLGPDKLSEVTTLISDGIMTGIDMDAVRKICMTLVCFYVVSFLLSFLQSWIMSSVTQSVAKQLRGDISQKINALPMWYYNHTTTGDVLSRITNDVDTIGQSLNQCIANLVHAIVLFLGSLLMMLKTNGIMTLTAVLATLIGFALMGIIMSRSQKYFILKPD